MNLRLMWCAIRGHQPTPDWLGLDGGVFPEHETITFTSDGFTVPAGMFTPTGTMIVGTRCAFCGQMIGLEVTRPDGTRMGMG